MTSPASRSNRNREREHDLPIEYVRLDVRTELSSLAGPLNAATICEILGHLAEPERVVADAMGDRITLATSRRPTSAAG